MKKLFIALLILVALGVFYVKATNTNLFTINFPTPVYPLLTKILPCQVPVRYKIGYIDSKFKISEDSLLKDSKEASDIWNKASGKNLIYYDPHGYLTLNLIYDERQSLQSEINNIDSQIQDKKSQIEPTEQEYKNLLADFNQKMASLNSQIKYWNSHGGAPPDEYDKLMQQKQDLINQANEINTLAKQLNKSASEYNLLVDQFNQTADSFDEMLQNKPEEGLFKSASAQIDIYLIPDHKEFIHTLAHEFGHALGLSHTNNKNSIMYPFSSKYLTPTTEDLKALQALCSSGISF